MWHLSRRLLPDGSGSAPSVWRALSASLKRGKKDHVLIKAADESNDRKIPRMDSEYAMGYELTMELLQEGQKFTAIAGQNDMMAIGAIDALHEMRIHVPKDVSVIGCDNIFIPASAGSP